MVYCLAFRLPEQREKKKERKKLSLLKSQRIKPRSVISEIKHVLASQIIEGWANHGLLSRSRL